ncbi:MAG TPA: hypothetical protein DCL97_00640 [Dehalococcoidia bacterium]|nr:hypothetical protein [Dehalococcoidia bacterium]HAI99154.1 hypothetical protein [Dehalococcoidia bacterium]
MYCRAQLVQLQGDYEEITGLQTDIIAISTDDLSQASYVAESLRLDFPILYDPARMWCGNMLSTIFGKMVWPPRPHSCSIERARFVGSTSARPSMTGLQMRKSLTN